MSGKYSRRQVLRFGSAAVGAIPFSLWFERYAHAGLPTVRHAVSTPQGAAMLAHYRIAVAKMMKLNTGMPCGWTFQWYTHAVPTNTTKAAQVALLPAAEQPLANTMWDTCEAHHAGGVEDYFLPWHRMYVYFLERIVRKASGFAAFTLPYWDYTNASHRAVPAAFRNPASAGNALYRSSRNSGSNAGQAIDMGLSPTPLNLDAMKETTYSPAGAKAGFNQTLDGGLHGAVHVLVGNSVGMGAVPWAAYDPIFWMHHCNIDRIWASWNKAGGANPTSASWLDHQFVFADENCNRVVGTIKDFRSVADLGYTYDALVPSPRIVSRPLVEAVDIGLLKLIKLPPDPGPLHVLLQATNPATSLAQSVSALRAEQRVYLVVRDLQAKAPVGVLYNLYLGLPPNVREIPKTTQPVGTINFFDAMNMGMGKFLSFDVTDLMSGLGRGGSLERPLNLTIAPAGQANAQAQPLIGEARLVLG